MLITTVMMLMIMIMEMIKKMTMVISMLLRVKTMPHLEVLQAGVHLGKELRVATKKIDLKIRRKIPFCLAITAINN